VVFPIAVNTSGSTNNKRWGDHLACWPKDLTRRKSGSNLCYLWVYSDCEESLAFRRGKSVANDLKTRCPPGKKPALLLTRNPENPTLYFESDTEYVAVIDLPKFLSSDSPWNSYAAHVSGATPETLNSLSKLNRDLKPEDVAEWLQANPLRVGEVLEMVSAVAPEASSEWAASNIDSSVALRAVKSLKAWDSEVIQVFCTLIEGQATREDRLQVLRNLMSEPEGVADGGKVLAENIEARLEMLDEAAWMMSELIKTGSETEMQHHIEDHPWLISLDYARLTPQARAPRGSVDFLAHKFNGVQDIIELKGPTDQLIVHDKSNIPSSPHEYKIAPKLAGAITQALAYQVMGRTDNAFFEVRTKLESQSYVIIGEINKLDETDRLIFDEFRRSLHGIQIICFDEVAEIAFERIENIRKCLIPQTN